MLTKELLRYRVAKNAIRPSFVPAADPALGAVASALVSVASSGVGTDRATLEEQLEACGAEGIQPLIVQGLVKLVLDRMEFEEPSEEAARLRSEAFDVAARALRSLPDDATPALWETTLAAALPRPLDEVRRTLFLDHPDNRRLLEWKPLEARELLERYNLALVQGLVLRARRVTVRTTTTDLLRVRRVLRWLKFCRLVADVSRDGDTWTMDVEGPAEILAMQKKYGLQLATFVGIVPVLDRWQLVADVELSRGRPAKLELDERSPLVSPHLNAAGYVPDEIDVIVQKLADGPWELDLTPVPRVVGLGGLCVPDLTVRRRDGEELYVEFFHRWHRHQLARRLDETAALPDPTLWLAVDESLLSDEELCARVEAHPQVMRFKGFPSERKLRAILEAFAAKAKKRASKPRK